MRTFAYERPTHLDEAVALLDDTGPEARPLAGGTDLIIRLRDGTIRPRTVVDVKGIAELDAGIGELRRRAAHRGTDRDDRHHRGPARPRRLPGARRGGGRRGVRADPQPGDAGREHRQRVTRRRHGAGAARLRRAGGRRRSGRGADDPDRRGLRPLRGHDARARRADHRDRAAAPGRPGRGGPRPADAATRARPGVRHAGLRGHRGRRDPHRLRQPRARDRCWSWTRRGVLADPAAPGPREDAAARDAVRRGEPVPAIDAGEPRVPARDAPRPRAARGRDRDRAARRAAPRECRRRDHPARGARAERASRSRSTSRRTTRCSRSCATRRA